MGRKKVLPWVMRLTDYGKGHHDPELDEMTLGQIADRILADAQAEDDA